MKIIIILGIIFLCIETFRFVFGNYSIWKDRNVALFWKMFNFIESVLINVTLVYLIWYWVKH